MQGDTVCGGTPMAGSRRPSKLGAACVKIHTIGCLSVPSFGLPIPSPMSLSQFFIVSVLYFLLAISFKVYFLIPFAYHHSSLHIYFISLLTSSSFASLLSPLSKVLCVFKRHDCPFHERQEPGCSRAPVLKSCLPFGRQSLLGWLPPPSATVERTIE